jgi:hypothetical protein
MEYLLGLLHGRTVGQVQWTSKMKGIMEVTELAAGFLKLAIVSSDENNCSSGTTRFLGGTDSQRGSAEKLGNYRIRPQRLDCHLTGSYKVAQRWYRKSVTHCKKVADILPVPMTSKVQGDYKILIENSSQIWTSSASFRGTCHQKTGH